MNKSPKVTVLMPVYNSEKYVKKSIDSILNQTFNDFEFLIIDDGSTDNSNKLIKSYSDKRISLVVNEKNIGLIKTLNKGLNLARGKYIVRMDSDDISLPDRIKKQVLFMDNHSDVAVCGTWVKNFGSVYSFSKLPTDSEETAIMLLFENAIAHPTSIIRSSAIKNMNYREEYIHAEDYDLWARLSSSWKVCNLSEILLKYRVHRQQVSQKHSVLQKDTALKIKNYLLVNLGFVPTKDDMEAHRMLMSYGERLRQNSLEQVERWLLKLVKLNESKSIFDQNKFDLIVERYWKNFCVRDASLGLGVLTKCTHSSLCKHQQKYDLNIISLLIRSLIYSFVIQIKNIIKYND